MKIETFNQLNSIEKNTISSKQEKQENNNEEKIFSENLEEVKNLVDKNGDALTLTDIEKESNIEFSQLTEHLASEDETEDDLFKSFKNSISQIFKPKFKNLFDKFSRRQMTKASMVALMIALNLSPESIAEQSNKQDEVGSNESEMPIKEELESSKDTYFTDEKDFEKTSPLEELKIKDADFFARGNQEFIEKNEINIEQSFFEIGNEKFLINILSKEGPNNQKYFICHDNENASFDTALRAIENGGKIIALGNNENRFLYSYGKEKGITDQDPNRMFDKNNPYWPLAEKILDLLKAEESERIIALHNNSPHGNFHLDNIKNWQNISVLSEKDPDKKSLIWIPGLEKIPNEELQEEIEYYKKNGLNIVYEYVPENQAGDGSFSVYAAQNNIHYLNIETVMGNKEEQQRYLETIKNYHQIDKTRPDTYAMN